MLIRRHWLFFAAIAILLGIVISTANVTATPPRFAPTPTPPPGALPTPRPPAHVATAEEVLAAQAQWNLSRHAHTFDGGLGANTTCAQCKSPRNFDPDALANASAHDCAACKREPGQPRPSLLDGMPVAESEWKSITCDVCHPPSGASYSTALAFLNGETGAYEPVKDSTDLCNKCHVGAHGFEVIDEQAVSPAHRGWECTRCHGSHNTPVKCTDCHDPFKGRGVDAHAQHTRVDCTACHDAGALVIWQDPYTDSRFSGTFMPRRDAHALRSWPSHRLQTAVDCRRCHHPQGDLQVTVVENIVCTACHPEGASFDWCPQFPRDPAPAPNVSSLP